MNFSFLTYEYLPIFVALILSFFVSLLMLLASLFFNSSIEDPEKLSTYECGFNPFEDTRQTFDVKFYLTAIMFIVFDIEVVLLVPSVLNIFFLPIFGVLIIFLFIVVLTFGFVYEWSIGALRWEK